MFAVTTAGFRLPQKQDPLAQLQARSDRVLAHVVCIDSGRPFAQRTNCPPSQRGTQRQSRNSKAMPNT